MSKLVKWVIGLGLVAAIGTVTYRWSPPRATASRARTAPAARPRSRARARAGGAPRDAVPVLAATAETADVPVYLEGLGTARALNTVTVQPLVDGRLLSVDFTRRPGRQARRFARA